jgi:para-aminobenzoate synthetase component 1
VSVSPERFISIDASGLIEAKPIKGTIKRSASESEDAALINELKNSSKNQAENLMIVDLLRNDLSMSAKAGSVKVDKLFELESHPNVHHLVSTISAELDANTLAKDAITNAFPGGSITGAPKKRAMEIIEELEVQPRSLYCGSFGYFSDSGNADFNILIRSLEFRENTITCWGGGGITVDSDCAEEYEESLTKIRRIMETIEKI